MSATSHVFLPEIDFTGVMENLCLVSYFKSLFSTLLKLVSIFLNIFFKDNQFRKVTDTGYNSYPNTGSYPALNIADNDLDTFGNTGSDLNSWMSINLGFRSGIRFVTVKIYSHANNYKLDIGDTDNRYGNKFCADVPSIIYKEIKVECSRYMIGQYIVLYHASGGSVSLYIYELSAYIDV